MKRLVRYRLNFQSKWLTFSGVMMGVAFFLQALDFFALRQLPGVTIWQLLLYLVLPMVLEAFWCLPLRGETWSRAEASGVFCALICLVLLGQTILTGGVIPIIFGAVFFLLGGVVAVLITFGFILHRALGMMVFAAIAVMQVLVIALPRYVAGGYLCLVEVVPPICMTLAMMFLFAGIHMGDNT